MIRIECDSNMTPRLLNNAGQVLVRGIGFIDDKLNVYDSCFSDIWQDGQLTRLNDPTEWDAYWAAMNDRGMVAGSLSSLDDINSRHVGYWSQETGIVLLHDVLSPAGGTANGTPIAINNPGAILFSSTTGDYWLATPVPEPTTLILLATGFSLLLLRRLSR